MYVLKVVFFSITKYIQKPLITKKKSNKLYVQHGCGLTSLKEWKIFDASPTLRLQRIPIMGKNENNVIFNFQHLLRLKSKIWDEASLQKELYATGFKTGRKVKFNDSADMYFSLAVNEVGIYGALVLEGLK